MKTLKRHLNVIGFSFCLVSFFGCSNPQEGSEVSRVVSKPALEEKASFMVRLEMDDAGKVKVTKTKQAKEKGELKITGIETLAPVEDSKKPKTIKINEKGVASIAPKFDLQLKVTGHESNKTSICRTKSGEGQFGKEFGIYCVDLKKQSTSSTTTTVASGNEAGEYTLDYNNTSRMFELTKSDEKSVNVSLTTVEIKQDKTGSAKAKFKLGLPENTKNAADQACQLDSQNVTVDLSEKAKGQTFKVRCGNTNVGETSLNLAEESTNTTNAAANAAAKKETVISSGEMDFEASDGRFYMDGFDVSGLTFQSTLSEQKADPNKPKLRQFKVGETQASFKITKDAGLLDCDGYISMAGGAYVNCYRVVATAESAQTNTQQSGSNTTSVNSGNNASNGSNGSSGTQSSSSSNTDVGVTFDGAKWTFSGLSSAFAIDSIKITNTSIAQSGSGSPAIAKLTLELVDPTGSCELLENPVEVPMAKGKKKLIPIRCSD